MTASRSIVGFLIGLFVGLSSVAAQADGITLGANDPTMLELGVGGYDVFHTADSAVFRGELRFGPKLWLLTPILGTEVTTEGSVYGYGGLALDIHLGDHVVLSPNEAFGAWYRGNDKELGSTIEFRSGAELDWQFDDNSRIGVSFHHISNAGIGRHNPGEEEALALYSIPLGL